MSRGRTAEFALRTPEGVVFSLRLASPVVRCGALFVDLLVVGAAWSILGIVVGLVGLFHRDVAGLLYAITYFVLSQGYRIFTEWAWQGKTVGKRIFHLRVVDANGLRLTFAQVLLRNLLRFIDSLPAFYAVGGLTALANAKGQRLGDLAAGTLVVWEPPEEQPLTSVLESGKYNSLRRYQTTVARLRQTVGPAVARAAWQALNRRDSLDPAARVKLFREFAAHFRSLTPMPEELTTGLSDEQLVRNVVDCLFFSSAAAAKN